MNPLENQQCYGPVYVLFVLLIMNVFVLSLRRRGFSSDHFVHKLFIALIRENRHRFINKIEPFLFGNIMGYPQLYHWILSFLKRTQIKYLLRFNFLFFNFLGLILHLWFAAFIVNKYYFNYNMYSIVFYSILLYLSCGTLFNINNARNAGLSPRSFGLILGQLYVYIIIIYFLEPSLTIISALILLTFISFLSSQFTTQFIIFMSIFFSLLFRDFGPIVQLLVAFCLFLIIFPKTAKSWMIYQWKHKKDYVTYGTKMFLLPSRYSIWGDFFSGFWRKIKSKELSLGQAAWYILNNPVIAVLSGVPIIMFLLYPSILGFSHQSDKTVLVLFKAFIAILMAFVATSFKYTRFLGEPERYIDFGVSMICVLGALVFYGSPGIILIAVFIGFGRIVLEGYLLPWVMRRHRRLSGQEDSKLLTEQIRKVIGKLDNVRVMSNDFAITKSLLNAKSKFFYGWLFMLSDRYDQYEIFEKYGILNDKILIPLIKEYQISHFIQDTIQLKSTLRDDELSFIEMGIFGHLKLFNVCSKT